MADYTAVKTAVDPAVPKAITGINIATVSCATVLCVMTYNLADAPEGAGGFACIPGSHKSNFLREIPSEVRQFERPTHYVVQPALGAGDVFFFTEALVHGTMPWTAEASTPVVVV